MRRNNLDIYRDILKVAMEGAMKTHIVYQANLNFKVLKKYLGELLEKGLIVKGGRLYYATAAGSMFVETYDVLVETFTPIPVDIPGGPTRDDHSQGSDSLGPRTGGM